MTRGNAHKALNVAVEVSGMDVIAAQIVREAERALREAESQAWVDRKRAEFDAAVEEHCARFGFSFPEAGAA